MPPEIDAEKLRISVRGYVPVDEPLTVRMERIMAEIASLPDEAVSYDPDAHVLTVDYTRVPGWEERLRERVQVVRIGERIVITPPWEHYAPQQDEIVLVIDPGHTFGSGLHETTRLCAEALPRWLHPGDRAIDLGTGTGILAMMAVKLGACRVTAIDLLPEAVEAARDNVARNGLESAITVRQTEGLTTELEPADLIIANIVPEAICRYAPFIGAALSPGGRLITSGFKAIHLPELTAALQSAGLTQYEERNDGSWLAIIAGKPE